MAKATKTFKIGEYCKGGVITVEITGKLIVIIGKEWDFSTGSRKSSDQSKAKEFTRGSIINEPQTNVFQQVSEFLTDLTTSYYADVIIKWIESKIGKLEMGYNYWR